MRNSDVSGDDAAHGAHVSGWIFQCLIATVEIFGEGVASVPLKSVLRLSFDLIKLLYLFLQVSLLLF